VPVSKPRIRQGTRGIDFKDFPVMLKFAGAAVRICYSFFVRDELPFSSRARVHLPHGHLKVAAGTLLHCLVMIKERLKYALGRSDNLDFADDSVLIGRDSCCGQGHLLRKSLIQLRSCSVVGGHGFSRAAHAWWMCGFQPLRFLLIAPPEDFPASRVSYFRVRSKTSFVCLP